MQWQPYRTKTLNDGKYNSANPEYYFPGYLVCDLHPFGICNALTFDNNKWASNDSPENFKNNLKIAPLDWKYKSKEITYTVNSSGFRTHEWDTINWKESIVLLGCSNTFGLGLADDETITSLLEKKTGRSVVNLGVPGISNEAILYNALALFKFDMPYAVVVNWTSVDRGRLFGQENYIDLGLWTDSKEYLDNVNCKEYIDIRLANESNIIATHYYIGNMLNLMFKEKTKLITISFFDLAAHYTRAEIWFKIDGTARDLIHPGFDNAQEVSEYIYKRLK